MSEEVRFGSLEIANSIREEHEEHLCSDDNRAMKTVTFASDTPEGVLDRVRLQAQEDAAEDRQRSVMGGPLSEGTRKKIKKFDGFSREVTNMNWRSAKGVFEREGHADRFSENISAMAEGDDPAERAEEIIRKGRNATMNRGANAMSGSLDMGEEDIKEDRKEAQAARSALSSGCNHAEDHCENGDIEACEYLTEACGYDEDEVEDLLSETPLSPEIEDDDEDEPAKQTELVTVGGGEGEYDEMEVTPGQAGALRQSWGGYKAATQELPDQIDAIRENVINARQAGRAINAIREANGQDPIHWDDLHELLDSLERLPNSIPETRTLAHFGSDETAEPDESHEMPEIEDSVWVPTEFGYREQGLGSTRIEDEEVEPDEYVLAIVPESGYPTYLGDGRMGPEQSQKAVEKAARRIDPVDIKRGDRGDVVSDEMMKELREIEELPLDFETYEENRERLRHTARDEWPDTIGPAELSRSRQNGATWTGPDGEEFKAWLQLGGRRNGWGVKQVDESDRGNGYMDWSPGSKQEAIASLRGTIETVYDEQEQPSDSSQSDETGSDPIDPYGYFDGEERGRIKHHAEHDKLSNALRSAGLSGPKMMAEVEDTIGGDSITDLLQFDRETGGDWEQITGVGPAKAEILQNAMPLVREGFDRGSRNDIITEQGREIPESERANDRLGADPRRAPNRMSASDADTLDHPDADYARADRENPDADEPAIDRAMEVQEDLLTGPDDEPDGSDENSPLDVAVDRYRDELTDAPLVKERYVHPTSEQLMMKLTGGHGRISVTTDSNSGKYAVTHSGGDENPQDHQRKRASADDAVALAIDALHRIEDGGKAFGVENTDETDEFGGSDAESQGVIETAQQKTVTGDPVDSQARLAGNESGDVESETIETVEENPGGLMADERDETGDSGATGEGTEQAIPDEFVTAEGGQNTLGASGGSSEDPEPAGLDAARANRVTDGGGPPREGHADRLGWAADVLNAATDGYGERVEIDAAMNGAIIERDGDPSLWTEQASQDVVRYGIDGVDAWARLVETAEDANKQRPENAAIPVVEAAVAVAEDQQ